MASINNYLQQIPKISKRICSDILHIFPSINKICSFVISFFSRLDFFNLISKKEHIKPYNTPVIVEQIINPDPNTENPAVYQDDDNQITVQIINPDPIEKNPAEDQDDDGIRPY